MSGHQDLIWLRLQGSALESDLICAGGSCGSIHHSEGISQQLQSAGGDVGHWSMFGKAASNQHLVAQEWVCGGDCPRNRMLAGGALEFRVQLSNLSQPELDFPDNG
jgi:hypothetical protein